MVSSGTLLEESNIYGLGLLVRAQYETTGNLGHLCQKLSSLNSGFINFSTFAHDIGNAIVGARHPAFKSAPNPPNILTCIDNADKYLSRYLFKEKKDILRDSYEWLSDFAHPNFLSNDSAFELDKERSRFALRHLRELRTQDFQLMDYLDICAKVFVFLFDAFSDNLRAIKFE